MLSQMHLSSRTARIEVNTALACDKFHNLKELSRKSSDHAMLVMVIITPQTYLTTLNKYRSIVCLKSSQLSQFQEHKNLDTSLLRLKEATVHWYQVQMAINNEIHVLSITIPANHLTNPSHCLLRAFSPEGEKQTELS